MGSDPDIMKCLLNVGFPPSSPHTAPHRVAASNDNTYWCVYMRVQKKILFILLQKNLKFQVCPAELQ